MKPYFGKQVIERERRGSSFRSLKARHYGRINAEGDFEGLTHVSMSRHAIDRYNKKLESKDFTDVLGPVRGYLFSKIGCRWDDVYSELSRELGSGSEPMAHILYVHILDRKTKELDFHWAGNKFYVDDDGLLQHKVDSWRRRWRTKAEPVRKVRIDEKRWFVEIKGLWYTGYWTEDPFLYMVPDPTRSRGREIVMEMEWPHYQTGWGKDVKKFRFIKEKQASRKELRLRDQLLAKEGKGKV